MTLETESASMRIVSLLPSLTELVCALGRGDELVGVTHECDYPPGVELLPHLTRSKIPSGATSAAIDVMVCEQGGSLYELDEGLLAELRPDLILTQEQCDVCAVNEATVRRSAMKFSHRPPVESVNPTDLEGVFAMFRRVGELLDATVEAEAIIDRFEATSRFIAERISGLPVPRVMLLEWLDPPFNSGHWNPEIIARAGGSEVLGQVRVMSRRLTWDEVAQSDPEVIIVSACGFAIERTEEDFDLLVNRREWQDLRAVRNGQVAVTDGSAYFSRPGPRLEDSLRIAAAAIHPELFPDLAPRDSWRQVPAEI
jgi:iron complex transport system substrate-binding protein